MTDQEKRSLLSQDDIKVKNSHFYEKVLNKFSLTGFNLQAEEYTAELKVISSDTLNAINDENGTQLMLSAQMATVHFLQQRLAIFAYNNKHPKDQSYYVNAVVKLSNVFAQQVSLMQQLKGAEGGKVRVEHVHVHNGGQAVVGNVKANISPGD